MKDSDPLSSPPPYITYESPREHRLEPFSLLDLMHSDLYFLSNPRCGWNIPSGFFRFSNSTGIQISHLIYIYTNIIYIYTHHYDYYHKYNIDYVYIMLSQFHSDSTNTKPHLIRASLRYALPAAARSTATASERSPCTCARVRRCRSWTLPQPLPFGNYF